MKKLLLLLFIPNLILAEVLSVNLICKGYSDLYCDNLKCGDEPAVEMINIVGNTLVHRIHGNQFLNVDKDTVTMKEMDTDGSIGFSIYIERKTGEIEIIRGWDRPYHFKGKCELIRPDFINSEPS
tara:strand:+ start:877 stop:1251 length:375 start_codon:yes stop_codon:yes gene_type:complete